MTLKVWISLKKRTYWPQTFEWYSNCNGTIFMYIKEDSSAHQACIYLIQSTANIFFTIQNECFLF